MKTINFLKVLLIFVLFIRCNSNKKEPQLEKKEAKVIQMIPFPGGNETSLPHLFSNKETILLSWVKQINDSITQFNYSCLINNKWEEPREIITGKDWFVNWADFPSITENNGNLLTHHLKKSAKDTYAYDIKLNMLPSGDSQWETKKELHTDGTKTEHGFVTALPYKDDSFFITWLDGRNTGKLDGEEHSNGAMTIRAAKVSAKGIVTENVLLDAKTCSCCQTTATITDNGPIVLYRDRTDKEIRDIAITRRVNGEWTEPKLIYNDNWKINGCPVNGPKADAIGNNVAIAWFTAVNDTPKVQVIFSKNGGEEFLKPILVSNLNALGRVDIELIDPENAIVSWMEKEEEVTYLKTMKVNSLGEKSPSILVSVLDESRKTGFPQMERIGETMYFAWTVYKNEISSINTGYVPLELF